IARLCESSAAVTPAANRTTQSALIPSLPTAYLAPAASRWLATPPSCAVNKLVVACAWLVHDAVVPRSVYRLKHRETQFRFNGSSGRQGEIAIAFTNHWLLKRTPMANREWVFSRATQRTVSGLTIVFLVLAAFFGFLNNQKVKALRTNATNAQVARDAAERSHAQQTNAPTGGTTGAEQQDKIAEAENRAAKAEADLAQVQKEKADLQAKLDANQQEIASLQKAAVEASKNANPPVAGSSPTEGAQTAELQSQVDDLRRQ